MQTETGKELAATFNRTALRQIADAAANYRQIMKDQAKHRTAMDGMRAVSDYEDAYMFGQLDIAIRNILAQE